MNGSLRLLLNDVSQVAAARRAVADLTRHLAYDERDAGRVALVLTEAATNVLKHAGHGELLVRVLQAPEALSRSVEIVALDRGPGFDWACASHDGYSTAGTLGGGLGAMRRIADACDIYSRPGCGTVLRLLVQPAGDVPWVPQHDFEWGAVCVPHPRELVSGDGWAIAVSGEELLAMVVDGLGHGSSAHQAALAAVHSMGTQPRPPQECLEAAHAALQATRGAAMACARLQPAQGRLQFAGIGNVATQVMQPQGGRQMVSLNGIVGHNLRRIQCFDHGWSEPALLLMHTDGLGTQWTLDRYPGLWVQHPTVIAAVLYRDFWRQRDDVTVLVVRRRTGER